jgi:hypothetical protein
MLYLFPAATTITTTSHYDDIATVSAAAACQVKYACRFEWAHRIEDVLARRLRLLFLNKEAAREAVPLVAGRVEVCCYWLSAAAAYCGCCLPLLLLPVAIAITVSCSIFQDVISMVAYACDAVYL